MNRRERIWLARPIIETLSAHTTLSGSIYWPIINLLKLIGVDFQKLADSIPKGRILSESNTIEEKIWSDFSVSWSSQSEWHGIYSQNPMRENWFSRVEGAMFD